MSPAERRAYWHGAVAMFVVVLVAVGWFLFITHRDSTARDVSCVDGRPVPTGYLVTQPTTDDGQPTYWCWPPGTEATP